METKAYQKPRSEARARYYKPASERRISRSHTLPAKETKPGKSAKERLVFQATICGGFLALLLFINVINLEFTNSIIAWVGRNITHDVFSEEGSWIDSLLDIFNSTDDSIEVNQPQMGAENPADFFRIDENILRDINSTVETDVYLENNR